MIVSENPVKKYSGLPALAVLLFFALSSTAQSFVPVKDTASLRKHIIAASLKINTIQCDFTQEKNLSILTEKAVSRGKFYFKREDKVRLDYLLPVRNLVVMNGAKMMIENDKKTTQTDMHRNKIFQQLNQIIIGSINGSLFGSRDFLISFYESESLFKMELKPVAKTLRQFLNNIVIVLEKKDFTATRIEMNEISGDNTILMFSNKLINGEVGNGLFVVK